MGQGLQRFLFELIDTLWNVNQKKRVFLAILMRINRYIMECKLSSGNKALKYFLELIDTLWNVNQISHIRIAFAKSELIDTLWNVNNSFRDYLQELY